MALADYAHWNEDARAIWWQEEGRFEGDPGDPYDEYYGPDDEDEEYCDECMYQIDSCECEDVNPEPAEDAFLDSYMEGRLSGEY